MKTLFNVKWSNLVKIITILSLLMVISFVIKLLFVIIKDPGLIPILGSLFLIFIAVYYGLQSPQHIAIEDNALILKKLITSLTIDIKDIDIIEPCGRSFGMRLIGSGGYCGYIGTFTNSKIGRYQSYVGKYDQAFYIKTKSGKKYMMSCENREELISIVSEIKSH